MNIRDLSQDFFDIYGYYPDQDELQSFLVENGYYDDQPIPDNISSFRDSARKRKSFLDYLDSEENTEDSFSEFKRLISEIAKDAKQQHQHGKPSEQNLELLFMLLVFLNKMTLFFLLRYCHENEIFVDL